MDIWLQWRGGAGGSEGRPGAVWRSCPPFPVKRQKRRPPVRQGRPACLDPGRDVQRETALRGPSHSYVDVVAV